MEGVIGFTTMFAGNFAPKSWALCQGQTINISSNTALFSILGTQYGGNGTTTFMLPDLRGRKVIGAGSGPGLSPYAIGQKGGVESITLSATQMPTHSHPLMITSTPKSYEDVGNGSSPGDTIFAANGSGYSATSNAQSTAYAASVTMTSSGSDMPYEILQPYLGLNFIICQYGVFPARN